MNIIMLTIDDPDDDSEHIINHRLVSWFNKYNQHNEYKNNIEKKKKTLSKSYDSNMASIKMVRLVYARR